MKLENYTTIDNEKLRSMIRFCVPSGISNYDMTFKNSKNGGICGRAYWNGCSLHKNNNQLIVIRIGTSKYPRMCHIYGHRGYLPYLLLDQDEDLVGVIAHELRHLWQHKHRKGYRVWGARGVFSERDADAYCINKIRAWRKSNGKN
jgi:hypothetical protein